MTVSEHLASYDISVFEARNFIIDNIDNPDRIIDASMEYHLTNQMLVDIYDNVSLMDVELYFSFNGLDSRCLDQQNSEDDYGSGKQRAGTLTTGEAKTAEIEESGDLDWFKVDLQAGQNYFLTMKSDDLDHSSLVLRDSKGYQVGSGSLLYGQNGIAFSYTPEYSGSFYLSATSTGATESGRYTLQVQSGESADEYAGSTDTSGQISVGDNVRSHLEYMLDDDWFSVDLQSDTEYQFAMFASYMPLPYFSLRDAEGQVLHDETGLSEGTQRLEFSYTPEVAGTYYLSLANISDSDASVYQDNRLYTLSVNENITTDDAGDTFETAGTITVGNTINGALEQWSDDDWYGVELQADQAYIITLESNNVESLELEVLDSRYGTHAMRFELLQTEPIELMFTPVMTDTYYIAVSEMPGHDTGTYSLTLAENSQDDNAGNRPETASGMEVGATLAGSLEVMGDQDWIAVELQAGAAYSVTLSGETMTGAQLQLHDSEDRFAEAYGSLQDNGNLQLNYTPLETDTYYIAVEAMLNNVEGEYLIGVMEVTPDNI